MEENKINKFICNKETKIVDAMEMIDINAKGILFIVNNEKKVIGSLTDGDIRRWILKSGKVTDSVECAMNHNPILLNVKHKENAEILMEEKSITAIPLTDNKGTLIDIYMLDEKDIIIANDTLKNVTVVIMAGGKGTRLYPYTKILPKPLIPIGDTPIVERIINYYTNFGINEFYMTVNYKKAMIRSYFDELSSKYTIKYVEEDKPLGTGGSLKLIEEKFDMPIFVTNCDALILADYNDIYQYHLDSGNDITMVSSLKKVQIPYGVLHTGENGVLESIEEKPRLSYFINTGMYVINPGTIDFIPENQFFHMTHLVEKVIENGGKVGAYPISEDSFLDMGEFSEMKRMEEKLKIVSD